MVACIILARYVVLKTILAVQSVLDVLRNVSKFTVVLLLCFALAAIKYRVATKCCGSFI